jgi:transposase
MTITEEQFRRIEGCFPKQRGNVAVSNLDVLNAILYVAEHGCKWRGLPKRFGRWHTIYTRMNRWAKAGVLDRVFTALQEEEIIRIKVEALSVDSTIVQVHPDADSMLVHMALLADHGHPTSEYLDFTRSSTHIYGTPTAALVEKIRQFGTPVTVSYPQGGFDRLPTA